MPRARRLTISQPTKFRHDYHVRFDKESGQYLNLPPSWRRILAGEEKEERQDTSELSQTELASTKDKAVIRGKSANPSFKSLTDVIEERDTSCRHELCGDEEYTGCKDKLREDDGEWSTLIVDLPPLETGEDWQSISELYRETSGSERNRPVLGRSSSMTFLNRKHQQNSVFDSFVRHKSVRRKAKNDAAPPKFAEYNTFSKHEMSLSLRYGLDQFEDLEPQSESFSDFVSTETLRQCYNKLYSSQNTIPIPGSNFTIPSSESNLTIPNPDSNISRSSSESNLTIQMPSSDSNFSIPNPDSNLTIPIPDSQSGSTSPTPPNVISDAAYIRTFNLVFETANRMEFLQHIYHNHPPRIPGYTTPYLMYISDAPDHEQWKRTYRTAILHFHPDRHENSARVDESWNHMCVEISKLLNRHYGVYKNITDF